MTARPITPRQLEIIDLLQEPGATQQSVADELGISAQTIKNHLTLAYRTLGVRSIAQAARAIRQRRKSPPVR